MDYKNLKVNDITKINSYGALAIITSGKEFLLQEKTPGYLLPPFIGTLALYGGHWTEEQDISPYDTIIRELTEEIKNLDIKEITPFGDYFFFTPKHVTEIKDFETYVSVFKVRADFFGEEIIVHEGKKRIKTIDEIARAAQRFMGGHEIILMDYLGENGIETGLSGFEDIRAGRVTDGDPFRPYLERNLDILRVNPLREAQTDLSPFEP